MADQLVDGTLHELRMRVLAAAQIQKNLPQPEQIEVIDQQAAVEHEQPAGQRKSRQQRTGPCQLDVPDRGGDRSPLPEQQRQHQTGDEHEGTALDRLGDDSRPPLLETGPGHDAVLKPE